MSTNGKIADALLYDTVQKLSAYGEYSEIFLEDTEKQGAVYDNNQLDRVENLFDSGFALRVISDGKTYFAYSNEMSEEGVVRLSEGVTSALKSKKDEDIAFYSKNSVKYYKTLADTQLEDKIKITSDMNSAARLDRRIVQATCVYAESMRSTRVVNSAGGDVSQSLCYVTGYTAAVASDGKDMQQGFIPIDDAFAETGGSESDFTVYAERSAKLALQNLDAKHAPAGIMTVVIGSSAGGTMVHEAVGHGLEADLACNGMSVYAGQIGEKVAADIVSVSDNGTLDGRRGSFIYDDEGVKASGNILIEDGILKKYMSDRLYGLKEGIDLTGNGRRENYRHRPIVRMTNTFIMSGDHRPEDIVKSVNKGLFVSLMGGGQVNTVTGDFVFEVREGFLMENGKLGEPVKNATLIGNGPKVMRDIDMVGSDLGFAIGVCGKEGQSVPVTDAQPTLRIPEITVGGR